MENKEFIKGLRKAKNICLKYARRTQDAWVEKELVKELNDLIKGSQLSGGQK